MSVHLLATVPVTQRQLRELIAYKNSIYNLRAQEKKLKQQVLMSLQNGAEVEDGIHIAVVREKTKGGKRVEKLRVR